ncbi:sodium:solute symporter family protein [Candidatus Viridilinea mediisalina]|uniref:Cation acetate symporter n=1 Tax=Candidatus Viridilinea mediisalina TaxID=2024553 RepID=A0A2A6RGV6_9CHLR|nr:sodium:solute symporter family protein [Candidatus Viridilinea mediisalina]PDW02252.1 cation acetate symporter [Candidatus Viridilinea mediisalina]
MTAEIWTGILVLITFGIYIYIGYWARVRDTKGFYVAGQGVPPFANGAATAADWMSAASFISMAGLISGLGFDGSIYLLGWTGGYVLLTLLLAPYLRKFGKYTVPDFVGDRYYSQTARAVAAVSAIFISLTYVVGQMRGVGVVFSRFLGLEIVWGVVIGMVIVAFFAVLGGMKGITWTQVIQYFVLITAFLIPAVAISLQLTGNPVPQFGLAFSNIVADLDYIHEQILGEKPYTEAFRTRPMIDVVFITLALMAGTAGLPHVIVRFYTVPNVRGARYSGAWALFFIALLYLTAPAVAVFARYNLIATLHDQPLDQVRELGWVRSWEATGLLSFDDKDGDGFVRMDEGEITINNDIIVLATPEVAQLPPFVIGLVAAGGLAASLSTASGLLLVISSSVAHDIYYRLINPQADEQRQLLVGRIVIFFAVVVAGYFGVNPPGFVAEIVAFAFGLAASVFFPIILLGIFDKRTNSQGAIAGMLVGLIFTAGMILMMRSTLLLGTEEPIINDFFGISAQGIGVVGMILNFVVAFTVSHLTPPPPAHIQELVENVRNPFGSGAASSH